MNMQIVLICCLLCADVIVSGLNTGTTARRDLRQLNASAYHGSLGAGDSVRAVEEDDAVAAMLTSSNIMALATALHGEAPSADNALITLGLLAKLLGEGSGVSENATLASAALLTDATTIVATELQDVLAKRPKCLGGQAPKRLGLFISLEGTTAQGHPWASLVDLLHIQIELELVAPGSGQDASNLQAILAHAELRRECHTASPEEVLRRRAACSSQ